MLDLTVERGWLCARLLADLGADVVKVEPPGGDPGRATGLFADPLRPDVEENLSWWFQNRGKSSVVLDLDDAFGRERLLELVADVDVVVESFEPGWLEARGIGPDVLLARNPSLVVTSITPFGRTGPRAGWSATDLTIAATTGELWLTGDADRPPLRISSDQLFLHAGAEAAVHSLVALSYAQRTGVGQHVDVSAQLAGMKCLMNAQAFHVLEGYELSRSGPFAAAGRYAFRVINECLDGFVAMLAAAGPIGGPMMRYMMDWADAEGVADPFVKDRDYLTINFKDEPQEFFDGIRETFTALFARHTKAELYQAALDHLLLLAPLYTVADIRADEQLAFREYFVDVDQGERGTVAWAGPWAHLSATPLEPGRRAPRVGEHDAEVAARPPRSRPKVATPAADAGGAPFEGLRVLDLSWVGVGPMTAGYLAAYGATVIKIESSKRPDVLRLNPPFRDGDPTINNSHFYGDFNAGKMSVGLDLADPRGREVAWRAIEWADVILESFTPKALAGWQMDYSYIRERNPSVVMLSTCMQGQTGPRRFYRGFGNLMAGLAGFYELAGWPDRTPTMIYGAYTDFVSQRFTATALLAALDHRRRTGEGQHIDVAQLEASLQFLGPELLAYELDGRVAQRNGNRHADLVPHGVFPCVPAPGRPDGWVAIACADDEQWCALAELAGLPHEERWATAAGRRADEDRIEELIAEWTASRSGSEIASLLQPRVACAPVLAVPELHTDEQILHRGYWFPHDHPVYGRVPYSGMQATLSRTPGTIAGPAPCLGEHTWYVLDEILGVDSDTIAALLVDEVAEITG